MDSQLIYSRRQFLKLGLTHYFPDCRHDSRDQLFEIVALVTASGITQYKLRCRLCMRAEGNPLPYRLISAEQRAAAEIVDRAYHPICERCLCPGAELHHWAPRSLFFDSYEWPVGSLCPVCHRRWHDTMRRGE